MPPTAENPSAEFPALLPQPESIREEQALVERFLEALKKRFEGGSDPEVRQRLLRAMQHPVDCPKCAAACHVYQGSGWDKELRPGLRASLLRRVYHKFVRGGGRLSTWWYGNVDLDWKRLARLAQLAYGCNLCERCVETCGGSDHALISRALRGVFQEMGLAPVQPRSQDPAWIRDRIAAIDEHTSQHAGLEVRTPWDVEGTDVLLLQPPSLVTEWPENVGAVALLLSAAGVRWTMSSELAADDPTESESLDGIALLERAQRYVKVAASLKAKKIVAGESGPAFRALCANDARAGDIPRESAVTLLRDLVQSGRLEFDAVRNDFPVTLHDPCDLVRRGVVEPQREVLRRLCPQFREMDPWAERNYCCGGGGGLTQIKETNGWRLYISGKKKMEQVLEAFSESLDAGTRKYLCAPCGDCKTQLQQLLDQHAPWEQHRIRVGGLAELAANALLQVRPGFLNWEDR